LDASVVSKTDPLGARASLDPFAARTALVLLRRVRGLSEAHGLTTQEIEEADSAGQRPMDNGVRELASVLTEDATKLADQLWSGNARSGRSLADIAQVVDGGMSEVPPDERTQAFSTRTTSSSSCSSGS
jgi:hypothetical protein